MTPTSKNHFTVEGTLKNVFETQNVSATFRKREFILEVNDGSQYPQLIKFELIQDKTVKLDLMKSGDPVKVDFQLRGREWTDPQGQKKFFTTLNALEIEHLDGNTVSHMISSTSPMVSEPPNALPEDDLPF
jgi:hypothetical protein